MQRTVLVGCLLMLAAPFASALELETPTAPPLPLASDRYIVAFSEDPGAREGDLYMGARVVQYVDGLEFLVVEATDGDALRASAILDARVRYVTWDDPMAATVSMVPNDARYGEAGHYGSKKIGAEAAWDRTTGSTAVKMQVLDSGIYRTHEDVAGARLLQGYDFVNNDNDPNDQGSACAYHGSHTAGTSGATINNGKGIAGISQHTILPTKAFYPYFIYCTSSTTALVNGLKYGGDQGAHISSNSWGMSADDPAVTDALVYAAAKGTVHVAAAGNSGGCTDCVSYPWKARGDLAIVVSATDSNDAFASFSSEGPQVDLAAPGVGILSLGGGVSTYQSMDGTSMAAPHVAGAAALVKALNPGWGLAEIEAKLKATAVDLGPAGADVRFGAGRVNVDAATAGGGTPPPPATVPSAPQALTATHSGGPKSGKIDLAWQAPASNGGAAITGYNVYRGTSAGSETLLRTVGNVLTFQDSGLARGVTYHYRVSAINSAGEGPLSNGASAIG